MSRKGCFLSSWSIYCRTSPQKSIGFTCLQDLHGKDETPSCVSPWPETELQVSYFNKVEQGRSRITNVVSTSIQTFIPLQGKHDTTGQLRRWFKTVHNSKSFSIHMWISCLFPLIARVEESTSVTGLNMAAVCLDPLGDVIETTDLLPRLVIVTFPIVTFAGELS